MAEPIQRTTATHANSLSTDVLEGLRKAYDIGTWRSWLRTAKGSSNLSILVDTSSGKYVLRCSNPRKSVPAMKSEVALISYLRMKGYPAPESVPTKRGESYLELKGALYLITHFISGDEYDPENQTHLEQAAYGLGMYHRLAKDFPGPRYERPTLVCDGINSKEISSVSGVDDLARRFLSDEEQKQLANNFSYIRDQLKQVQQQTETIYPRSCKLMIQGSFGRSALIFNGNALAGVVDYDRTAYDIRGMDLAYSIKAFCRVHDRNSKEYRIGIDYARARDFLNAYQEAGLLPKEEIRSLPLIFRNQRLMKVLNKYENLRRKNLTVPQQSKDIRKFATMIEKEVLRLSWLKKHHVDLQEAFVD